MVNKVGAQIPDPQPPQLVARRKPQPLVPPAAHLLTLVLLAATLAHLARYARTLVGLLLGVCCIRLGNVAHHLLVHARVRRGIVQAVERHDSRHLALPELLPRMPD